MNMKIFKLNFSVLLVLLIGIGCTSNSSNETDVKASFKVDKEFELEMMTQLDLILDQKKDWYKHWSSMIGSFDASNFKMVLTDSIDSQEMPERNPILQDDPLFAYQFVHPAANGTIDIYSYKIESQDAIDTPFLNPDSEVIWYRADGMKERLLFMGPSGMFEEGKWINENEFVVLGYFQEESGFRPMVWFIDVSQHRIWQFNLSTTAKTYEQDSYLDQKIKQIAFN
jgi:hypothetical protein